MNIYAKGKNIPTYAFGNLFTQGENFADTITFIVDRYYCGKDLSLCSFAIRGVTEENWEINQALPQEVLETTIRLSWNVSDNFTHNAGTLRLELRASETVDEDEYTIIKYNMPPVTVNPTISGENGPLPGTAEQTVSEINEAAAAGLMAIEAAVNSFDIESYEQKIADETDAALSVLQQKMDDFQLEQVQARLDGMAASINVFLARPEVVALTQEEYDRTAVKENSLYVII